MELHGDVLGVDHNILGAAGMDIAAMDGDQGRGCVEVFVFQFSHAAAVYGVGIFCAEVLQIKEVSASSDLLVRGEADAQSGIFAALCHELLGCGEDLGNTDLVISAQ